MFWGYPMNFKKLVFLFVVKHISLTTLYITDKVERIPMFSDKLKKYKVYRWKRNRYMTNVYIKFSIFSFNSFFKHISKLNIVMWLLF